MGTPLADLSLIKPLFINAISNIRAMQIFINYNLWLIQDFVINIAILFITLSMIILIYLLIKNRDKNKTKKEILKISILQCREKIKVPLRKLRYIFIWEILIALSRAFVSFMFYFYDWLTWYNCQFSPEENHLLSFWAALSLIIFVIAPVFIMFCFGNKFIRNIWILIYIFWILFIAMWKLISISCAWM